ncbi:hypothetical protein [Candidatus Poriferisodalis sp.]
MTAQVEVHRHIGDRFEIGLVLYTGSTPLPVTDRIAAIPLSYLWEV